MTGCRLTPQAPADIEPSGKPKAAAALTQHGVWVTLSGMPGVLRLACLVVGEFRAMGLLRVSGGDAY